MYERIQSAKLSFPEYLSEEVKDLLKSLLDRDPKKRLGSRLGADEVKFHIWFKEIDWNLAKRSELEVPKPKIKEVEEIGIDRRLFGTSTKKKIVRDWEFSQNSGELK